MSFESICLAQQLNVGGGGSDRPASFQEQMSEMVESRMGAVAWGLWPTSRFPSPLIKPGVPISGTGLSDWLHRKAYDCRPLIAGVERRACLAAASLQM